PDLAVHECLSAIRAKFARGDCDLDGARDAAGDIIRLEWQLVPGSVLARQTLELSLARHRLWTYDASYLALAQSLGVEFWTADRRLAHAVSDLPFVKLLGRDEFGYTDPSHPEASS
ncbi:MAG: type II toxin-antitoxin system VapC family toxin, partial [Armatimonadota bacterium]